MNGKLQVYDGHAEEKKIGEEGNENTIWRQPTRDMTGGDDWLRAFRNWHH
jgi:hypothetical protein